MYSVIYRIRYEIHV